MSSRSVYERVLEHDFTRLDPRLQRYFGAIPLGRVGRGHGVYESAGGAIVVLRPFLALLAWRRVLFPESGRDVPFEVINAQHPDGSLHAVRTFSFARRTRLMVDRMEAVDGALVDRLGRRGGLEVTLHPSVHGGALRMRSTRLRGRICGCWVPLPRVVMVTLDERTDPDRPGHQRVDVRLAARWIGEILRYTGSFEYRLEPDQGR